MASSTIASNPSPSQCLSSPLPPLPPPSISRVCLLNRSPLSHASSRLCSHAYRRSFFSAPGTLTARLHRGACWKLIVSAASFDEAASVDIEKKGTKVEELREELEKQAENSKESWNQAVDNLKDEATKAEADWKGTSGESAEKIIGVLRDTTEQLKEQAEKARAVLAATAQETAERSKENLTYFAENAPDPIKDIAETALKAHSPDKKGAKIHDFCLGIPYGGFLVTGGLLWFIISGSTAAIRFGVILGGILLGLSVTSLKVWKQGNSSMPYIVGQAVITLVIMLREIRRFFEVKAFFPSALAAIASAGMLGFYSYIYLSGGNPPKKAKQGSEA